MSDAWPDFISCLHKVLYQTSDQKCFVHNNKQTNKQTMLSQTRTNDLYVLCIHYIESGNIAYYVCACDCIRNTFSQCVFVGVSLLYIFTNPILCHIWKFKVWPEVNQCNDFRSTSAFCLQFNKDVLRGLYGGANIIYQYHGYSYTITMATYWRLLDMLQRILVRPTKMADKYGRRFYGHFKMAAAKGTQLDLLIPCFISFVCVFIYCVARNFYAEPILFK